MFSKMNVASKKKLRIGIDARCLEWQRGAVARYLLNCFEYWSKNPVQHEYILYFQSQIPNDEILNQAGFSKRLISGPAFLRSRRILCEQILFPNALKKDKLDVFFAPWYTAPLFLKPPLVLALWDISYSTHPEHYSLSNCVSLGYFSRKSAKKAHHVITCSNYDASQISKFYSVEKNMISILRLAAESKFFPGDRAESIRKVVEKYHLPSKFLLSMGVIYSRRCVDKLILAFKNIIEQQPDLGFVVVGKNETSPYIDIAKEMQSLVDAGKGIYLKWLPEEDLVDFYRAAEYFICFSTVDGETIMLKEAMQCGTPVISSELLRGTIGNIGHIVADPNSPDEISVTLKKALSSEGKSRNQLSAEGLVWMQKFSWQDVANHTLKILETTAGVYK